MRGKLILGALFLLSFPVLAAKKELTGPLSSPDHWVGSDAGQLAGELAAAIQSLNPSDSRNLARTGELLLRAGQLDRAEKIFEGALQADRKDDEACRIIAVAYRDREMWDKSDLWFQRAVELDPGDPDHLVEWGVGYYRRGDKAKAAELFLKALKAEPGTERLYYKIGQGIAR